MPFSSHTSNFFSDSCVSGMIKTRARANNWVRVSSGRTTNAVLFWCQKWWTEFKEDHETLLSAPTGARSPAEVWVSSQAGCASLTPEVMCTLPSGSACGYWCLLLSDYTCRGHDRGGGQRQKQKDLALPLLLDQADIYLVCGRSEKNSDSTLLCSGAKNIFFFNLKESRVSPRCWERAEKRGWREHNNKKVVAADFRHLNSRASIIGTREQRRNVIRWPKKQQLF